MISVKDRQAYTGSWLDKAFCFLPSPCPLLLPWHKSHLGELPLLVKKLNFQRLWKGSYAGHKKSYKQLGHTSNGRNVPATDLHKPSYACIYSRDNY